MRQIGCRHGGKGQARSRRANGALVVMDEDECPGRPRGPPSGGMDQAQMNHGRKSGEYGQPGNATGTIPRAFLGDAQRQRVIELMLIMSFGADLLVQWRAKVDRETPIWWAEATRHLMPRRAARRALADLEGGVTEEVYVSTLTAATRWFCSFDLPASRKELWTGAPLFARHGSREVRIEAISRLQIRKFVNELGDKNAARWCEEHGVSEDALQLVVESLTSDQSEGPAVISAFRVGVAAGEAAGGASTAEQDLQEGAGGNDC